MVADGSSVYVPARAKRVFDSDAEAELLPNGRQELVTWLWVSGRMVGNMMGSKHEYDEALVELRITLQMLKDVLGDDYCQTSIIFNNIGNIIQLKGKPDDALIGYGKALAIHTKLFGENHNVTAQSHHNIGLALFKKNRQ